ncbi:RluA family pseudouridine synthase [Parabacteroides sp. PF5-9]|uniref:RluA family pseudouridine synthase n=1 Tax=Parabacteroides sp. PF5-9 TaxID=1742404 RepID=UPI00247397ED|nr:RluA family pseudouridine synthase [Parabacteroides sp. PF5-9]MDH6356660.1 23S rRNA pseudouridine1911/1915/1917 synthase [Parabacteroides sp. PF5-9]
MNRRLKNKNTTNRKAPRERKLMVKAGTTLLPFLLEQLKEQSRSSVKALLGHGQVSVNGQVCSQFDTPLSPNDVVGISYERGKVPFSHPLLKIVWEDDDLIVVNKKEGLLSVSNAKAKERTAYQLLSDYVKKTDQRNKIFLLNKLDRGVSGLMMFARNRGVQEKFYASWRKMVTQQTYVAVVEGRPEKEVGLLTFLQSENKEERHFIVAENAGEAIVRYKWVKGNAHYSLLELNLETGRREQIREQLGQLGHPVAGDSRHHAETDPEGRLLLHSRVLTFIHPETGQEMSFKTAIPSNFVSLTK